jgi:hypothetical protein
MHNRNKRVLWLLNHRTLMPYEAKLLVDLGYELFTPKVIPGAVSFRSGAVDHAYDRSLTIPAWALARLNAFNFYDDEWPGDIVSIVNRYFGTVYVIPYGRQVSEATRKFEGQIMLRAFGLDNSQTYVRVLELLYGERILRDIEALGKRFWFAGGYDQLVEVEPPFFSERQVFLPLGVPDSFWRTADSYVGNDRRILFVCPNCVTNPYYAAVYRKFKDEFGDLPQAIVGTQDVPVDDPHVLGFVSDAELARLYRECAVMYYHSTELRHVHYSPIEAAINGMPVIYYADSLLGRMTPGIRLGRCANPSEARAAVQRVLAGDAQYIADLREQQKALAYQFSDEYCKKVWQTNLRERGVEAALVPEERMAVIRRELKRTLLRPLARGLSTLPRRARPPRRTATTDGTGAADCSTLADGIDFTRSRFPHFVAEVNGICAAEPGGRWSEGSTVLISFYDPLPRRFRLEIVGGAYGPNVNAPVTVKVGRAQRLFRFEEGLGMSQTVTLDFSTIRRARRIALTVPHPVVPPNDMRAIGLMLSQLRILSADTAQA